MTGGMQFPEERCSAECEPLTCVLLHAPWLHKCAHKHFSRTSRSPNSVTGWPICRSTRRTSASAVGVMVARMRRRCSA